MKRTFNNLASKVQHNRGWTWLVKRSPGQENGGKGKSLIHRGHPLLIHYSYHTLQLPYTTVTIHDIDRTWQGPYISIIVHCFHPTSKISYIVSNTFELLWSVDDWSIIMKLIASLHEINQAVIGSNVMNSQGSKKLQDSRYFLHRFQDIRKLFFD